MTDSVKGISGSEGASSGGSYSGGSFSGHHKKKETAAPLNDQIDISQDARDRAKGKTKKGILDYLRDLLG